MWLFPNKKTNKSDNIAEDTISWLEKRIKKTEKEHIKAKELNLKIGKGAKLKVYRECLNYIHTHK